MTASTIKSLRQFKINVSEQVLADLHVRLSATRWLPSPQSDDWSRGVSQKYMHEFVDYWKNTYNWREQEKKLNAMNHYTATIDDAELHYVYHKGSGSNRIPLLLIHGWPDSFYRFHKILPMLTKRHEGVSFDVIIPSLPGFGFTKGGLDLNAKEPMRLSSEKLFKLMTQVLGYEHFAAAGGDGGSPLAQLLAIDHPEVVKAIYITDPGYHTQGIDESILSSSEKKYAARGKKEFMEQGAYAVVQTTKPMSLAFALEDSPVALASWIIDRFYNWVDGDLDDVIPKAELLTNIMIYWAKRTITSSMVSYKMEALSPTLTHKNYVTVPTGVGLFPKDLGGIPPREFVERTANVQHWKEFDKGGHFTAWEQPQAMADDLFAFFSTIKFQTP